MKGFQITFGYFDMVSIYSQSDYEPLISDSKLFSGNGSAYDIYGGSRCFNPGGSAV